MKAIEKLNERLDKKIVILNCFLEFLENMKSEAKRNGEEFDVKEYFKTLGTLRAENMELRMLLEERNEAIEWKNEEIAELKERNEFLEKARK